MRTRMVGAKLVDPTNPLNGQFVDIVVEGSQLAEVQATSGENARADSPSETAINFSGCLAMAGGIDLHTHIGGGKLNLARLLMQDLVNKRSGSERGPLWSSIETGRKYANMGYTACFEPAMLLSQARATHWQLADTPGLDSGAYVVMGNEEWLLRKLAGRIEPEQIDNLVAWTIQSSQALAVKVVNAGGISAFKFNQRMLDVDQPHARYGTTPRRVLHSLASAIDRLGLAHPLHVHASNLGVPGNIRSTLATLDAAEGHRMHLTHAQFNAYTDDGPMGMGSGAVALAERINRSPELSIDVGQIVFGQTVTISADTQAQHRNRRHAHPNKTIVSDVECSGGCGIVPMRYQCNHYVSSLQWTIGLELMLLIKNPYQVLLTTDHPNGGPFTSYPHLIRLLMDQNFRQAAFSQLHPQVVERSLLKDLDREYTLDEIAVITRVAPAKLLGLIDRGQVQAGRLADLVFYEAKLDWEQTFTQARSVWKSGIEIMRDGRPLADVPTRTLHATPRTGERLVEFWQDGIEQQLSLPISMLEISPDEFAERMGTQGRDSITAVSGVRS